MFSWFYQPCSFLYLLDLPRASFVLPAFSSSTHGIPGLILGSQRMMIEQGGKVNLD